jgi:putative acetyltransferase
MGRRDDLQRRKRWRTAHPGIFGCGAWPAPDIVRGVLIRREVAGDAAAIYAVTAAAFGKPVLALGPLSVRPDSQRRGVGSALMHAVLGAGDALDEPLVALLGSPVYYRRFGFRLSDEYGIAPPVPEWRPHFQVRALSGYQPPFDRV